MKNINKMVNNNIIQVIKNNLMKVIMPEKIKNKIVLL